MTTQTFLIDTVPALLLGEPCDRVFLFLHGQEGCKEEALSLAETAVPRGWQVLAIDLPGHGARREEGLPLDPWHALPDIGRMLAYAKGRWGRRALFANSIGAWFGLLALSGEPLENCLLVSPVLDMARLIETMMGWAGVTEEQLQEQKTIPTGFGQTLSWDYLRYAREHPVGRWDAPAKILYAGKDHLTERETVDSFARRTGAAVTVMEDGEHWFHTPAQLAVLRRWVEENVR